MARKPKPSGLTYGTHRQDRNAHTGRRALRPQFLIVCEGSKTEPYYFEHFRVNINVKAVEVRGLGDNTLSLVKRTCEFMQAQTYEAVWCVFDRDSFPAQHFNAAIDLAKRKGIQVAYFNEAFELWYLLHFHYHDVATSRSLYKEMLSKRLGHPYQKNDPKMYQQLKDRQSTAIRNAQKLLKSYGPKHKPAHDNPSTTIHHLVQVLNKYVR